MSDEIKEFFESLPKGRCRPCKYARVVFAQDQFMFLGCYHEPYRGKWVAEIKDCPKKLNKEKKDERETESNGQAL